MPRSSLKRSSPSFLVDKNLGAGIAVALRLVEIDAAHLTELGFAEDTDDDVWMEAIGKEGRCFISRDTRIHTNKRLKNALKAHKVGAFFLGGKCKSARELIEQVVTANRIIEEKAMNTRKPFIFIVRPNGRHLDQLPID